MSKDKERILVIVESPNKVKTLKSFLPGNYIVMASVGHITEIGDGGGYHNTGIDVEDGFKPNLRVSRDKQDVVRRLKEQAKLADKVYLASDPDREGEAIAWSLKEFLKIPASKCYRATFHEITKKAVLDAIEHPRKIDTNLVNASHARQKLDKLLGYRMSTIARDCIGARSVGRCQSAGLELIADKEKSIREFIPEEYGELVATLQKDGQEFKAKYMGSGKKDAKPSFAECTRVADEVGKSIANGGMFRVAGIERKTVKSSPRPPFITSTFQQEVSSRLGLDVEQAMQCAQKLFEGLDVGGEHIALITYIRTDDATFSPEFEKALEGYVKSTYGDEYYSPVRKAKKSENAQAGHEAIRPVDLTMTPGKLAGYIDNERLVKVYEIIYRRSVACAMAQSQASETSYTLEQSGYKFSMVSREVVFDGYRKVYNYRDADDDGTVMVSFAQDEDVRCTSLEPRKKETTPPARYKEATFIKELERTGIGRPSTYASILKTLKDESRGYCTVQNKCLVPTDRGMQLAGFLQERFPDLINVGYTSNMEHDLDMIANGKLGETEFLQGFLDDMEKAIRDAGIDSYEGVKCPVCGAPMKFRKGPYGPFLGCTRYPECKGIRKIAKKQQGHGHREPDIQEIRDGIDIENSQVY